LNPRNELYRERDTALKTPTRTEAIRLMSTNPNLTKRPVVAPGDQMVLGLEAAYRKLLK